MRLPTRKEYPPYIWIRDKAGKKIKWKIKFVRLNNKELGVTHWPDRLIELHPMRSKKLLAEIFIHEVLHAIEFEGGVCIPHRLVYDMQSPLLFFMLDNVVGDLFKIHK